MSKFKMGDRVRLKPPIYGYYDSKDHPETWMGTVMTKRVTYTGCVCVSWDEKFSDLISTSFLELVK
jgi:hypothetical protein